MTWIKTNFLWMMYRSGWACKKNQEVIQISSTKKEVTIASLHGIRSYSAFGLREIFSNGCCGLPSRHSMENMPRMKTDLNAPKEINRAGYNGILIICLEVRNIFTEKQFRLA